ncbi:hypothetical protein QFZ49_007448 [Streptomyces turgidiscabies]|uniref:Uncharacterized protein n=1 Tax=Streptomyces turgidiscabies TaxID=85558 RepID=A0ABU0S078_9ACTN|nr:hypothetical protein [Streptomyces turgidiscabies]
MSYESVNAVVRVSVSVLDVRDTTKAGAGTT